MKTILNLIRNRKRKICKDIHYGTRDQFNEPRNTVFWISVEKDNYGSYLTLLLF